MGWDNDQWGHMHQFNNGFGYYGAIMGVLFLAFIGLLIWAVLKIAKSNTKGVANVLTPHKESPKEILDRRLANGEVSAEDYQRAKELLNQ